MASFKNDFLCTLWIHSFQNNWAMCLKYLLLDKCMVQDTTCSKDNLDQSSNFYNLMKKNINFQIKNPSLIWGK